MKRKEGWEIRLNEFLDKRKTAPFIWGKNDCSLFSADGVKVLTFNDPASWFRKKYSTEKQAYQLLKMFLNQNNIIPESSLVLSVAKLLAEINGFPKVPPLYGKRGDIAAVDSGRGVSLGIIDMSGIAVVTPGDKGLESFPLNSALCAWSV